jgi:nucleotide-binding universal stress UspA family protein
MDLTAETRAELEAFVPMTDQAGGAAPGYHVVVGRPVDVICECANREEVDVIVLGSSGLSGPAQVVFGSTTDGVLVRSDISVLVVPPSWEPPRADLADLTGMGPITVGFEHTAPALAALRAGCRLAAVLKTTVAALHVVPPIRVLDRWRAQAEHAVEHRMEEAKRVAAGVLRGLPAGVEVRLLVKSGDVATTFAATIAQDRDGHALAVVGRRSPGSRSGPPAAIAARVMSECPAPVLVYLPSE